MALDRAEKAKIMQEFGKGPQDTGSSEVQVALLSKDINQLTEHCKEHHKDFGSRRGLIRKVYERKKLLKYLERTDEGAYKQLISKLGLRK